jgi:hypothetical protein
MNEKGRNIKLSLLFFDTNISRKNRSLPNYFQGAILRRYRYFCDGEGRTSDPLIGPCVDLYKHEIELTLSGKQEISNQYRI